MIWGKDEESVFGGIGGLFGEVGFELECGWGFRMLLGNAKVEEGSVC